MTTVAALFGEVSIDEDNYSLTCDSSTDYLDEGDCFVYSPVDAESLITMVTALMTTLHGATVTATISESGKLTLSASSSFTFTLSSDVADILGFDSVSQSGANSYEADQYLKHCFFPQCLTTISMTPTTVQGRKVFVGNQVECLDGSIWGAKFGTLIRQHLEFHFLSQAKAWNLSDDNSSFEEFWTDTLSQNRRVLFIPEYDSDLATYWEYKLDLNAGAGVNMGEPVQSMKGSHSYWNVNLPLLGVQT